MSSRRHFLKLIRWAPAAPLAAKAAAENMIAQLAGVSTLSPVFDPTVMPTSTGPVSGSASPHPKEPWSVRVRRYLSANGIPSWVEAELWEDAKRVVVLDPDIAAKKSWSFSVKLLTQRERNYSRLRARFLGRADRYDLVEKFGTASGLWL